MLASSIMQNVMGARERHNLGTRITLLVFFIYFVYSFSKSRNRVILAIHEHCRDSIVWHVKVNARKLHSFQKFTEKYPGLPVYILGFSLGSYAVRTMGSLLPYKKEILIGTGDQQEMLMKLMQKKISKHFSSQ